MNEKVSERIILIVTLRNCNLGSLAENASLTFSRDKECRDKCDNS